MEQKLTDWCDRAVEQVRFWPDQSDIRNELEGHMEDRCAVLEDAGYAPSLAAQRVLAAMGDAAEVGRALDREHHPLLGWLWLSSVLALVVCGIALLLFLLSGPTLLAERIWETVSPTPYEEWGESLDETYDFTEDIICMGTGSAESLDIGDYTLEVPKSVWWDRHGRGIEVKLILESTPRWPWYGAEVEFTDDLHFADSKGTEVTNIGSRSTLYEGGISAPWASVGKRSEAPLGKQQYTVTILLNEPTEWVEISYPYGDRGWGLRVRLEAAA